MSDKRTRDRIATALTRRIDPAESYQLGGQTFRPLSEAAQPMTLTAPSRFPASLMNPVQDMARTPHNPDADMLNIAPASIRQVENEQYALQRQMLEQDRIRRGEELPPDPRRR